MKWNLENRKLADLKPFKRNPRTFTKKGMSDLKQSIDKFGLCEPIIIQPSGLVIGGHARLDILKKSGVKEVDVYVAENELSEEEFKELNVRLNRNIGGEFSFEMLQSDFKFEELISMGFEENELGGFGEGWNPEKTDEALEGDGINDLVGYGLQSFWKQENNNDYEQHKFMTELPSQNSPKGYLVKGKYSRTHTWQIERIIRTYMRKGDIFLENCCGWSTFGSSAKYFGYSGIGIDIWDTALEHSKKQISKMPGKGEVEVLEMDGMNTTFKNEEFDYVYCNPPFMDEEKYSGNNKDIADSDFDSFAVKFTNLMEENRRILKKGKLCTITINDKREKGLLIPLQKYVIDWSKNAGFQLHDFVIAEVLSQKIRLRKKDYELKRTVKCHEYVITFIKN